jgi:hypothetical protein
MSGYNHIISVHDNTDFEALPKVYLRVISKLGIKFQKGFTMSGTRAVEDPSIDGLMRRAIWIRTDGDIDGEDLASELNRLNTELGQLGIPPWVMLASQSKAKVKTGTTPVLDENGAEILRVVGAEPDLDAEGNEQYDPVLDEDGQPMTRDVYDPDTGEVTGTEPVTMLRQKAIYAPLERDVYEPIVYVPINATTFEPYLQDEPIFDSAGELTGYQRPADPLKAIRQLPTNGGASWVIA